MWCPECGKEYDAGIVACAECRVALVTVPPMSEGAAPVVVHRVPDAASGALLCGVLVANGITAVLRSTTLPGYGLVPRDWSTSAWGEIMVPAAAEEDARALIGDYLAALASGGPVRDEEVE
jgi:hypothetical protein